FPSIFRTGDSRVLPSNNSIRWVDINKGKNKKTGINLLNVTSFFPDIKPTWDSVKGIKWLVKK
ncbi:hypothetical protein DRQ23_00680, partial [bacterium]